MQINRHNAVSAGGTEQVKNQASGDGPALLVEPVEMGESSRLARIPETHNYGVLSGNDTCAFLFADIFFCEQIDKSIGI